MSYFPLMLRRFQRAAPAFFAALAICLVHARARAMNCTILNTASVRYGAYDVFAPSPVDSAGLVSFRCTAVVAGDLLSIQLSRGKSGRFLPRAMLSRGTRLEYNLYLDAARTVVWGDGTAGSSTYTARPADGETTSVPIYGRIPARQNVEAGTYDDIVVLTILY